MWDRNSQFFRRNRVANHICFWSEKRKSCQGKRKKRTGTILRLWDVKLCSYLCINHRRVRIRPQSFLVSRRFSVFFFRQFQSHYWLSSSVGCTSYTTLPLSKYLRKPTTLDNINTYTLFEKFTAFRYIGLKESFAERWCFPFNKSEFCYRFSFWWLHHAHCFPMAFFPRTSVNNISTPLVLLFQTTAVLNGGGLTMAGWKQRQQAYTRSQKYWKVWAFW